MRIAGRRCLGAWEFTRIDFQQTPAMDGRIQSPSLGIDTKAVNSWHESSEPLSLSSLSCLHSTVRKREEKERGGEGNERAETMNANQKEKGT